MELFDRHRDRIRGALIDRTMPGWDGLRVRAELLARDPRLPITLTSGFTPPHQGDLATEAMPFLQKPFKSADLRRHLKALLGE